MRMRTLLALACFLLPLTAHAEAEAQSAAPSALPADGRIVLAPLNLGVRPTPQLEPGVEPVWQELVDWLAEREPTPATLETKSARALWSEVMDEEARAEGVYAAYGRFAERLAKQVSFSAVVIPALVARPAEIQGHQASWDGVRRLVEMPGAVGNNELTTLGIQVSTHGGRGTVGAASLHVAIVAPDGSLLYEGAGGLSLLQRIAVAEEGGERPYRMDDHPAPFSDTELLREGVRVAFERPLPASAAR